MIKVLRWILLSLYLLLLFGLLSLVLFDSDLLSFSVLSLVTLVSVPLFLASVGFRALCVPAQPRRLVFPAIVAGTMAALLTGGFVLAMIELCEVQENDVFAYIFWGILVTSWIGWTVLLFIYTRRVARYKALFRLTMFLFAGSLAELLAAVPSHLIVIRRPGCLVGLYTMLAIVAGVCVMVWTFGPGLALLFLRESYRQQQSDTLCHKCLYDLRGTLMAGGVMCPECGAPIDPAIRDKAV